MTRFLTRYIDIVVGSQAFGTFYWLSDSARDGETRLGRLAAVMLVGAYCGYLSRCYRLGKAAAESAADDRSPKT